MSGMCVIVIIKLFNFIYAIFTRKAMLNHVEKTSAPSSILIIATNA